MSIVEQPFRFPGQYFDGETGLYYNYFRDYDPGLGRYVQSDPIGLSEDFSNPMMRVIETLNAREYSRNNDSALVRINHVYAYSRQNPLTYADPLGLRPVPGEVKPKTRCQLSCWDDYIMGYAEGLAAGAIYTALGGSVGIAYAASMLGKMGSSGVLAACLHACNDEYECD
ncbi:RHS repeat-associated core domain-containing protein [Gilvimarinus agarilyticus]|uniref:RHS repeat-associated core domain-containing protein n=1 Tax=Gilvimarinus agarilyticus TaxID=679259 RepID=UPI0005A2E201|nr:RHS repeat-associated core domain-containing protein [Gilvimarinus agarilyticus]